VVITTKNRCDDLLKAIRSALGQSVPVEVLVVDDGSTDGTAEAVRAQFPQVALHHVETSEGYIRQRNRGAALASTDVIFSIDDDAEFSTPHVVAQTLREFSDPRICAVAIPFINVRQDQTVRQRAPDERAVYLTEQYIGTAHALRRALFLAAGGYRAHLFHQGEEFDYCIRALDRGYVVRLGRSDPIHHYESPRRSFVRMDLYGRRNDVLFCWHNVPWCYLPWRLFVVTLLGLLHGIHVRRPWRMLQGLLMGYAAIPRYWCRRAPVKVATYRLSRRLRKHSLSLADLPLSDPSRH
jgi:glycosyltransferase involved in cell wall biosynthesis